MSRFCRGVMKLLVRMGEGELVSLRYSLLPWQFSCGDGMRRALDGFFFGWLGFGPHSRAEVNGIFELMALVKLVLGLMI